MKIASFNVENFFDRPIAFNLKDTKLGGEITKAAAEFNAIVNKPAYSAADQKRLIELIKLLKLTQQEPPYVWFRKIRGQLWTKPKSGPLTITATGSGDWVGWVELKEEPNNAIAVMNTGRVIAMVDADIFAVVEAENRTALKKFSEQVLKEVGGVAFDQIMLIDGNDDRGIDVGLMTRKGYTIGDMRSHVHDLIPGKTDRVYSRDCPEYAVKTPKGETIWVLPNHFKSKYGGNDQTSKDKRKAQAKRTREIYEALIQSGHDKVVVLGDLNDTPDSAELHELLSTNGLKDISGHPSFTPDAKGSFKGKGTFGLGNDSNKIDYLLLSPKLYGRIKACGIFRKGAWPGSKPQRWDVFPELKKPIHAASDHHVMWVELTDP